VLRSRPRPPVGPGRRASTSTPGWTARAQRGAHWPRARTPGSRPRAVDARAQRPARLSRGSVPFLESAGPGPDRPASPGSVTLDGPGRFGNSDGVATRARDTTAGQLSRSRTAAGCYCGTRAARGSRARWRSDRPGPARGPALGPAGGPTPDADTHGWMDLGAPRSWRREPTAGCAPGPARAHNHGLGTRPEQGE
jgi:hypothetical protein